MKLLLDTQLVIFAAIRPSRLTPQARDLIIDPSIAKLFSTASMWEAAIKAALRRPDFDVDPGELLRTSRLDFAGLRISADAAVRVAALPHHHRDPFDRLLIAQAAEADLVLLTADRTLLAYGPHVQLV